MGGNEVKKESFIVYYAYCTTRDIRQTGLPTTVEKYHPYLELAAVLGLTCCQDSCIDIPIQQSPQQATLVHILFEK